MARPCPRRRIRVTALFVTALTTGCGPIPFVQLPGGPAGALGPGDLVINEVMIDPLACGYPDGQYIELVNTTDMPIDLTGLELSNGTETFVVTGGSIPERGYGIGTSTQLASCYPVEPAFTFDGVVFGHAPGATVEISNPATLIDRVDVSGWTPGAGSAYMLRPENLGHLLNDASSAWCLSGEPLGDLGDFGSPGVVNTSCANQPIDSDEPIDSDVEDLIEVTLDEVSPGDLVITEVFHSPSVCDLAFGQYIEVYNTSDVPIDLAGLLVTDGSSGVPLLIAPVVQPGDVVYLAAGDPLSSCFVDAVLPDGSYPGSVTIDVGETLTIGYEDVALDSVPIGDFDWTAGVALELSATAFDVTANDDAASWCNASDDIAPGTDIYDRGSPGIINAACPDPVVITPQLNGNELERGDLVITEVMTDPANCQDYAAEYFEVYNNSGVDIDLNGLTIILGDTSFTLTGSYPVAADDWALAEIMGGSGSIASCYVGLDHDFVWNTGTMADAGVLIELQSDLGVVDAVDFTDAISVSGRSYQLDPGALNHIANDSLDNWCYTIREFRGSNGDRGTPSEPNELCGNDLDTDTDTAPDTDLGIPLLYPDDLLPGDLVITEFFADPTKCSDYTAEYIEIYNNTDGLVDLTNLTMGIGNAQGAVLIAYDRILPGEYGLLVHRLSPGGGCYPAFPGNARYDFQKMDNDTPNIWIGNATTRIDQVDASTWNTIIPGAALVLDPRRIDGTLNDDPSNWCHAPNTFLDSAQDRGSPMAENVQCFVLDTAVDGDTDTDTDAGIDSDSDGSVDSDSDGSADSDSDGGADSDSDGSVDSDSDGSADSDSDGSADTELPGPMVVNATSLVAGDLIITEFFVDPADCPDFAGEYIEFYNATPYIVDPAGLQVGVDSSVSPAQTISPIPPGGYGIARHSTGSVPACPLLDNNFIYVNNKMDNSGSRIRLFNGLGDIDQVDARGWSILAEGMSAQLDPTELSHLHNDDELNWCAATVLLPNALIDRGTPGQANDADPGCFP